ncbi:L-serine ammonia-lyase [Tessaracoccus sp. G1721]
MGGQGCYVSALSMFSIGVGPSSSHTVGPMRAAADFADRLATSKAAVGRIKVVLFGSLGATGIGHGTPDAVVAGLRGMRPETCDPARVRGAWSHLGDADTLDVPGVGTVPFTRDDVRLAPLTRRPGHPNALSLSATGPDGAPVAEETYYSIGGGFISREGGATPAAGRGPGGGVTFDTAADLLRICSEFSLSVADVALRCERAHRPDRETHAGLDAIWGAMCACIAAGLSARGTLPGPLHVPRRAAGVMRQLEAEEQGRRRGAEWLQVYALAVNEANASGERVVTAPTNGAAGIIPAVAQYYLDSHPDAGLPEVREFLLTATAIGSLIKANASISGAEGGCQAEVGSACAMAAAGLCAVLGGTPAQVENAAEIAMEHHLGLTCDPIGGLVQVPCIERNAIAASTAVTAARLALHGDGRHIVSLDAVIATMRQTGLDMHSKYKETSTGGLAVNVVEC